MIANKLMTTWMIVETNFSRSATVSYQLCIKCSWLTLRMQSAIST